MAKEEPDVKKEAYEKPALKREGRLKDITAVGTLNDLISGQDHL